MPGSCPGRKGMFMAELETLPRGKSTRFPTLPSTFATDIFPRGQNTGKQFAMRGTEDASVNRQISGGVPNHYFEGEAYMNNIRFVTNNKQTERKSGFGSSMFGCRNEYTRNNRVGQFHNFVQVEENGNPKRRIQEPRNTSNKPYHVKGTFELEAANMSEIFDHPPSILEFSPPGHNLRYRDRTAASETTSREHYSGAVHPALGRSMPAGMGRTAPWGGHSTSDHHFSFDPIKNEMTQYPKTRNLKASMKENSMAPVSTFITPSNGSCTYEVGKGNT
ncbi:hypothetical protein CYMTET_8327 [Cymbomonas tetramitiformis]|uniref:Uncharacterized protein n=1 Tax=Cymbomonas tetramitiformis TaxID=36881 RepID=A0AAE0GTX3_9CHLO|nr:hypothetical protein CYMTET_8327 [Cymbomonas tetramitiformis]